MLSSNATALLTSRANAMAKQAWTAGAALQDVCHLQNGGQAVAKEQKLLVCLHVIDAHPGRYDFIPDSAF
jgi:hypothetical protein